MQKTPFFKLHFIAKYQLTRRYFQNERFYTYTVDKVGIMRVNYDDKNSEYIEVRPSATDQGYISARIIKADKATTTGLAQIISRPFGIYDFTMLDFLKSRPDLFR